MPEPKIKELEKVWRVNRSMIVHINESQTIFHKVDNEL